ncbi:MAG TPA: hypothetical protein VJ861_05260 [Treponemataceae bacterium]|nr:hypothetical protein [Treponemataceae bacterium]
MKRLIFVSIIILLLSNVVIAEEDRFDGYAGLAWGSSVQELKKMYPETTDLSNSGMKKSNVQTFEMHIEGAVHNFFFFKGELYSGRTEYNNLDIMSAMTLGYKIKEEYGEFTVSSSNEEANSRRDIYSKKITDITSVTIEISELNSEAGILGKVNISIQKNHDEVFRTERVT